MTKHDNVSQGNMKATEFVKKHGIEKAKHVFQNAPCIPERDYGVNLDELRQIIESHLIVKKWGGIENSLREVRILKLWGLCGLADMLEKAIADVEACQ